MDNFPLSLFLMALIGMGAGFGVNRAAMAYLGRYTGVSWHYRGLAVVLFGQKTPLDTDMVAVEFLASLLSMAAFLRRGDEASLGFTLAIIYIILLLCVIDVRIRLLPNSLTLAGTAVGLLYVFFREDFGWADAFAGMAAGAGFPLLTAWLYSLWRHEEGLGMGDVKLLAFFGTFAGWQGIMLIIAFGSFAAAVWGVAASFLRNRPDPLKYVLAFGPFLGGAAVIFILI